MKRKTLYIIIVVLAAVLLMSAVFVVTLNIQNKSADVTEVTTNEEEKNGMEETSGRDDMVPVEDVVTFGEVSIDDVEALRDDMKSTESSEPIHETEETIESATAGTEAEEPIESATEETEAEETLPSPEVPGASNNWGGGATGL